MCVKVTMTTSKQVDHVSSVEMFTLDIVKQSAGVKNIFLRLN